VVHEVMLFKAIGVGFVVGSRWDFGGDGRSHLGQKTELGNQKKTTDGFYQKSIYNI